MTLKRNTKTQREFPPVALWRAPWFRCNRI